MTWLRSSISFRGVKVTVVSAEGQEAVVAIFGADEFIGEDCLIGQLKKAGDGLRNNRLHGGDAGQQA